MFNKKHGHGHNKWVISKSIHLFVAMLYLTLTFIKIINSLFRDIIVIGLKFSETAIIVSQVSCCLHFQNLKISEIQICLCCRSSIFGS